MRNNSHSLEDLLFTKTFQVLVLLLKGDTTIRNIAADLGVTDRAVNFILKDLEERGLIKRARRGRINSYTFNLSRRLFGNHGSIAAAVRVAGITNIPPIAEKTEAKVEASE